MRLQKKAARNFVNALTVAQLRRAAIAYACGVPFENFFITSQTVEVKELPEYLLRTRRYLSRAITTAELAAKLHCTKDTAWTYIAKLRKHGVCVHFRRRYGKTVYWIENG